MDATPPWVEGLTIGAVLRAIAQREPHKDALVFPQLDFRATYAEYDAHVDQAARGLMSLGLGRGDHIAVWSTNRPEWSILQLASARIGAVLVTLNPACRTEELVYTLKQSDAQALFLLDRFKSSDYLDMTTQAIPELSCSWPGRLESALVPRLRWVVSMTDRWWPGMTRWADMLAYGKCIGTSDLRACEARVRGHEPTMLQYTSGTTGAPKGVLLSHNSLLLNAYYVGVCQGLTSDDRVCVPVPFHHCFGAVIGTLASMVHGTAMLVPAEYFDARATLECIEAERATAVYGVPTMFIAMLEDASFHDRDLSSLRTGVMAGAPCPVELVKRVMHDLGAHEVTIGYGLTEASPVITQTRVDDPEKQRLSTVGRPIPGVEIKVVDPGDGTDLPLGEQGELCARGHNVMLGYHGMPEATAEAIDSEGWLHSGDLATVDSGGFVHITGRKKDMIIRGGENIYPREVEEVLHQHPAVEDAQVVGVPDERLGEELCAWIRLRSESTATEEEVKAFLRGKVAHYKIPRYVDFVESFPLTETGKVRKYEIREAASRMHGAHAEVAVIQ